MGETLNKATARPLKDKFSAALFVKWQPKKANFSLLITENIQVKVIPAPIYGVAPMCLPWSGTLTGVQVIKSSVGLLRARDWAKNPKQKQAVKPEVPCTALPWRTKIALELTELAHRCQEDTYPTTLQTITDHYTGQQVPDLGLGNSLNGAMAMANKVLPYRNWTPLELSERASGVTWLRVQSPTKMPAINDPAYREFMAIKQAKTTDTDADTGLKTPTKDKERGLKRYQVGEKIITKGLNQAAIDKIKQFGTAVQNQAVKSNPFVWKRQLYYGSHITLTLPGIYPTKEVQVTELDKETGELLEYSKVVPDYTPIKNWFKNLIKAIQYAVKRDNPKANTDLYYCYVIEEQERGAPHFHIVFAHFMPFEAIKKLWSKQLNKYRSEVGLPDLTPNEVAACATWRGIKSYANYLTKYICKSGMQVAGSCWGLSEPGRALIKPNKEMPVVFFENAADAAQVIANCTGRAKECKTSKGKPQARVHTNLATVDNHRTYLNRLAPHIPKYKPPATWISNPTTAYQVWKDELLKYLPPGAKHLVEKIMPKSAIFDGREAVPLYRERSKTELKI